MPGRFWPTLAALILPACLAWAFLAHLAGALIGSTAA